jgi:chromosome segregation ATPase
MLRRLLAFVWIALGLSVVVAVASVAFAVGRGLGAWRAYRRTNARLSGGLEELNRRVEVMEQRLETANEAAFRLEHAQAELQASLEAARVVADAAAEVRRTVRLALRLLPTG